MTWDFCLYHKYSWPGSIKEMVICEGMSCESDPLHHAHQVKGSHWSQLLLGMKIPLDVAVGTFPGYSPGEKKLKQRALCFFKDEGISKRSSSSPPSNKNQRASKNCVEKWESLISQKIQCFILMSFSLSNPLCMASKSYAKITRKRDKRRDLTFSESWLAMCCTSYLTSVILMYVALATHLCWLLLCLLHWNSGRGNDGTSTFTRTTCSLRSAICLVLIAEVLKKLTRI